MKLLNNYGFDNLDKKFEEEVKNHQLSKIVQLNNLRQTNDNIIKLNSVEDIGKKIWTFFI